MTRTIDVTELVLRDGHQSLLGHADGDGGHGPCL